MDRWRVRLSDVPSTIGWDGLVLWLRHLPYDSETMRELHPETVWNANDYLVAHVVDAVHELTWVYGKAHGSHDSRPKPIERPKNEVGEIRKIETADIDAKMQSVDWR